MISTEEGHCSHAASNPLPAATFAPSTNIAAHSLLPVFPHLAEKNNLYVPSCAITNLLFAVSAKP